MYRAANGATIIWDLEGVLADTTPVQRESFRTLSTVRVSLIRGGLSAPFAFGQCFLTAHPQHRGRNRARTVQASLIG